jgi:hypothetical protein
MDLTAAGFEAFFLQPLRKARFGVVAQGTAEFGMGSARRVMGPMVRTILGGADAAQLRSIARQLDGFRT